jgi:hypothetical protein
MSKKDKIVPIANDPYNRILERSTNPAATEALLDYIVKMELL